MTKSDIELDSAETPCFNEESERNAMEVIPKDIEKKLQVVLRHIEESAAFDGICGKDFNDATSVSSLALASGLSARSLRDYFKAYTGQSLVNYVSQRRAEYAARIFRLYPAVSKAQVAYSLGFNFPNGIYRLMRKQPYQTPYLRSVQEFISSRPLPRLLTIPSAWPFFSSMSQGMSITSALNMSSSSSKIS
ncbi:MAG: helix-turn-helix transcriptional regulator [Bacteroidales bacterium]|nr:helix-turn-helix transcriptional regulator [Bacteroidales bacterium]